MTITSRARVATGDARHYLRRLCQHFADPSERHSGQAFDVSFDDREGSIDFAPVIAATCRIDATEPGVLTVEAHAGDEAALGRVQRIVTKHLKHFGQGEDLTVDWNAAADLP